MMDKQEKESSMWPVYFDNQQRIFCTTRSDHTLDRCRLFEGIWGHKTKLTSSLVLGTCHLFYDNIHGGIDYVHIINVIVPSNHVNHFRCRVHVNLLDYANNASGYPTKTSR